MQGRGLIDALKEKHLRPGRKITDRFIPGSVLAFLVVIIFKGNRPMLKAVKYCKADVRGGADSADGLRGNRGKPEHTDVWAEADRQQMEQMTDNTELLRKN